MMNIRKFVRSKKGISPIFASLILIAIAVIAGIVVYMFTSGTIASMTGGGTAGQEKVAIQTVVATNNTASITVWAKSTGGTDVMIDGCILKDSGGATLEVATFAAVQVPSDGTLTSIGVSFTATTLYSSDMYTVTLTSVDGGSFVSSAFKPA
jgi:flagellin-like protein